MTKIKKIKKITTTTHRSLAEGQQLCSCKRGLMRCVVVGLTLSVRERESKET